MPGVHRELGFQAGDRCRQPRRSLSCPWGGLAQEETIIPGMWI